MSSPVARARAEAAVLAAPIVVAEDGSDEQRSRVRDLYTKTLTNASADAFAGDDQRNLFEAIRTIYRAGSPVAGRSAVLLEIERTMDPASSFAAIAAALDLAVDRGRDGVQELEYYGSILAEEAEAFHREARKEELRSEARAIAEDLLGADRNRVLEALRRANERTGELTAEERAPHGRFQFLTDLDLRQLTPPGQLIQEIMPAGGLIALVGPPGTAKTFLALDWACTIRAGIHWVGLRAVAPGPVVYVIAEGSSSLGPRLEAWSDHHLQGAAVGVSFLTRAVQLLDAREVADFILAVQATHPDAPALVVFDTMARCMLGGDENSAQDMGRLIAGVDGIREATGAAVLLVHHTNASGDRERGSTALRGAVDTMLSLRRTDEGLLRLTAEKQKDAAPFEEIILELTGHLRSCIVTSPRKPRGDVVGRLSSMEVSMLRRLHEIEMPEGVPSGQWETSSGQPASSFHKYRKALWDGGFLERDKVGKFFRYRVSARGQEVISP